MKLPLHRFRGGDSFGFLGVLLQTGAKQNYYLHTFRINIGHELLRRFVCSCGRQMSYITFDPLQSVWWPCWSSFAQRRVWHRAGKGMRERGRIPKEFDCSQVWKDSPKFVFFFSSATVVLRKFSHPLGTRCGFVLGCMPRIGFEKLRQVNFPVVIYATWHAKKWFFQNWQVLFETIREKAVSPDPNWRSDDRMVINVRLRLLSQ